MAHRGSVVGSSWDVAPPGVGSSVDSRRIGGVYEPERTAGAAVGPAADLADDPSRFYVVINGTVDSCLHPGGGTLYCRFKVEAGPDWEQQVMSNVQADVTEGVTQCSERGAGAEPLYAFNLPFSVSYATTNPFGWPKLSVSVYRVADDGKRSPPAGYGWCHVPTHSGLRTVDIPLFVPISSTPQSWFLGLIQGHTYEFKGNAFSKDENREVTRVAPTGASVKVTFNILTKGLHSMGYRG